MKEITATRFKARCLAIMDRLSPEGVLITKRGRPVARLIPFESDCASLIGSMKGKLKVRGNIYSTGVDWDAESRHSHPH
jgi:prevent-host-death family protein